MNTTLLYSPQLRPNLLDYGIEIPLSADRVKDALSELEKNEKLWAQRQRWLKLIDPVVASWDDVRLAHNASYVSELQNNPEKALLTTYELIGPDGRYYRYNPKRARASLSELRDIQLRHVGALEMTARLALEQHSAYLLGGGLHHAMSFGGRGFCLVNDGVIVLRKLLGEGRIGSAWVVDVDAHKGDGTAELTQNDPHIKTLSIHMARGWPLEDKPHDEQGQLRAWHLPSTLDIPIETGEETQYLEKLAQGLKHLEKSYGLPDLVLVVQGSDPSELDELPSTQLMKLTLGQLFERDKLVFDFFYQRKIAQAYVMAGGYGPHVYRVYAQFWQYYLQF